MEDIISKVLLLNATYEPLTVITQRRALSLMLRQCVDVASAETTELHSVSQVLHIPAVIRLRYYVNVPQRKAHWSRRGVLRRDNYTCAYCGAHLEERRRGRVLTKRDFTVDHVLPVSRGGPNSWSNTVCSCWWCNQQKGDRLPHEVNMRLAWEPKTPRTNYLVLSGKVPAAWKTYLPMK
ncbi:MAG: HNH endonuclease [Anaerolineales bacterium]